VTIDWGGLFSLIGPIAVGVALVVLGSLSKRLGSVMRMPRYYLWFYFAAFIMTVSVVARLLNIGHGGEAAATFGQNPVIVILHVGLPAIATTLGLITAWRYWSWLLAERG
jgi:hypothetical protein